jgi:hypothetical protein
MKPPLFIRPLADSERRALTRGLRCRAAFTLRRCQILLASAQGRRPARIAAALGCSTQAVRDAINAFAAEGTACLRAKSKAPRNPHAAWPRQRDDDLRALLHQSPRTFGKPTSLWTLPLVAQVCFEKGWTARALSGEAIRLALKRLGVGWKRAKHWLVSPDPQYARKKTARPADRAGGGPARLGAGLPGRDVVDAPADKLSSLDGCKRATFMLASVAYNGVTPETR